jgi:hypothetical protein
MDTERSDQDHKTVEVLLSALRQAAKEPVETRLYKSGKLAGLFAGKIGVNGDAASQAVREGLLEVIRTEVKGKSTHEWVRLTPAGVRFLHERDSPLNTLKELKALLQATEEAVPGWLVDMRRRLSTDEKQLAEDAQRMVSQLQSLRERVENGLERLQAGQPQVSQAIVFHFPWAVEALQYLDQRKATGSSGPCPLSELFGDLSQRHGELTLAAFHSGLRTMHEQYALRLLPANEADSLPQPEYALLDGDAVLYYADR